MTHETATCRGCGRTLDGEPYYRSRNMIAINPETGERCKRNFYGGFVCSRQCDYRSSLEMESSFPGAGKATSLSSDAACHIAENWGRNP